MPGIVGEFKAVTSAVPLLDAHIGHLQHLTNLKIAKDVLRERHKLLSPQLLNTSKLISSHIKQALEFHHDSRSASVTIRPVLQYYCYLNLSVAAILAFRPINFNKYRRHGVEDQTHALLELDLSSTVLVVKRGAVPLFHSILSDVPLYSRRFRFGQLAAGFHMCSHELSSQFSKTTQQYVVTDHIVKEGDRWFSVFSFCHYVDGKEKRVPSKRLEDAMPRLLSDYTRDTTEKTQTVYKSQYSWPKESQAKQEHRANGLKFVNYGGHSIQAASPGGAYNTYMWHGVNRISLIPTLSSMLMMAFTLATIARYRPLLLEQAMNAPIALVINTFTAEADSVFIPSLRNLLYREELAVGPPDYI